MELNRGHLRHQDWQEVADAVNARHGHTEKTSRTHVQCKNRMDTLKKRYKIEKTKISGGEGTPTSSWPFFSHLEQLIGTNIIKHQHDKLMSSPTPLTSNQSTPPLARSWPPMAIPLHRWEPRSTRLTSVILPQRPTLPSTAVDVVDWEEDKGAAEESEDTGVAKVAGDEGLRRLANAIERFGEIYEKVERMKQMQMVNLEKQRMLLAKDLDFQRMQSLMDTWVQLEKIMQANKSRSSEDVSS